MATYLQNAWYAAAFTDELNDGPLARTLLDMPVVLFRRADGTAAMLLDRCPHRFAPLSRGKIVGDAIECGYHGLRFNGAGACIHNPHLPDGRAPAAARVPAFPVLERSGMLWFWPGDPSRADPALLPPLAYLEDDAKFTVFHGHLHVRANYQLIIDNLMDLSHGSFLHPQFGSGGVSPEVALAATTMRLERRERSVFNYRVRSGLSAPAGVRALFGFDDRPVHTKSHMTYHAPGLLDLDAGNWYPEQDEAEGLLIPQAHCVTPETEFSSHYFYSAGRNRGHDDPKVADAMMALLDTAFREQDEPMIEAVQSRMGSISDLDLLRPVLLTTDPAPVAARRLLAKLIAQEADEAAASKNGAAAADRSRRPAQDPVM
jgi:phenylpropionate dioxygenase-like ring-hydroxylating dioxygenase large terminal subunit